MLKTLYRYRGFISGSVKREFQIRYQTSMIGIAWLVIQPLAMILVYTLVFSQLMRSRLPGAENTLNYSIYVCTGILTWSFLSEMLMRGQTLFLDNANLLKKLNFPRICLPVILTFSATLNFLLAFSLFVLFLLFSGHFPGWPVLSFFPVFFLQMAFALGLAVTLGLLNVFFRDVGQFTILILQFWFWLTPVVYSVDILPTTVKPWLLLNPMLGIIQAYQSIFVEASWPEWSSLYSALICAIFFCLYAMFLFRRHSAEMVDEL